MRDNSRRRTVIQEQTTAESFLNITYTPLFFHFKARIQQSMAASLVRQPNLQTAAAGNAMVFDAGKNDETDRTAFVATGCIVLQNLPLAETACMLRGLSPSRSPALQRNSPFFN